MCMCTCMRMYANVDLDVFVNRESVYLRCTMETPHTIFRESFKPLKRNTLLVEIDRILSIFGC